MQKALEFYSAVSAITILVLSIAIVLLGIILAIRLLTGSSKENNKFILKIIICMTCAIIILGGSCLVLFETGVLSLH